MRSVCSVLMPFEKLWHKCARKSVSVELSENRLTGEDMSDLQNALRRLRRLHPHARMWNHGEIGAGQIDGENEPQKFILVHLYEHDITEHFRPLGGYNFIISNGFLASYAYNLALVWLQSQDDPSLRRARFCHNFKKFYAETLLHMRNVLIGRAFLLETLAYEQGLMIPIFDRVKSDPTAGDQARKLEQTMTSLAQHHELGHYFRQRSPTEFDAEMPKFLDGCLSSAVSNLEREYSVEEVEEVICDGIAAHMGFFHGTASTRVADTELATRLRRISFGFQAFFKLMDLRASARVTAAESRDDSISIELGSEIRSKDHLDYHTTDRQNSVKLRSNAMSTMLSEFAERRDLPLYTHSGDFPLSAEVWDDFDFAFEHFGDEATHGTHPHLGCDSIGRGIMRIVAESLAQHPGGVEHLLWRSKSFKLGGIAVDP